MGKKEKGHDACKQKKNNPKKDEEKTYNLTAATIVREIEAAVKVCKAIHDDFLKKAKELVVTTEKTKKTLKKTWEELEITKKGELAKTVTLSGYSFEDLNDNICKSGSFSIKKLFEKTTWSEAWAVVSKAKTESTTAKSESQAAVKAYKLAPEQAKEALEKCQCSVKKTYTASIKVDTEKMDKEHLPAWTKAYHLRCVLAQSSYEDCPVPALPALNIDMPDYCKGSDGSETEIHIGDGGSVIHYHKSTTTVTGTATVTTSTSTKTSKVITSSSTTSK